MRHTPAAIAVAMLFAVSSSGLLAQGPQPDPHAVALQAEGRAQLAAGNAQAAIDAFEAALVIDPAFGAIYIDLADASRSVGLPGKAIMYYRRALTRDPDNLAALAGEGEALAEKGALANARENLARLETLCGADCPETVNLAAAIARGPLPRVMTAEALSPDAGVTVN